MRASSGVGTVSFGDDRRFNGVKVFSATMMGDREHLGDKITRWLAASEGLEVRDVVVTQSSDEAYHCIAITIFYWRA